MGLWVVGEGLLLLLAFGGLVARYVPPHRGWWLQLLAIGLPLLIVPLGIAALLALRSSLSGLALLNAAVMVLIGTRFIHVDVGTPASEPSALTVVTYNAGGFRETPAAYEELQRVFAREEPDLVAWQEVSVHKLRRRANAVAVPRKLQATAALLSHTIPQVDLAPEGARRQEPVSTSLEAVGEQVITVSNAGDSGYSGSATRTQLVWKGRPFALYNVHLQSFNERPTPASWTAWLRLDTWREALAAMRDTFLQQEQEVERLREALANETLPYLICGDLNSTSSNWAYARLAEGLTDAFAAAGSGMGTTYHPQRRLVRIDVVLASAAWEVTDARVLPVYASDHMPVLARLHWKTNAE
jgi:endonuclease/exonuclease/phosphatase family metal-dependent hydrolase